MSKYLRLPSLPAGLILTGSLFFSSCTAEKTETTLYSELGGLDTIELIVDDFLHNISADTVISDAFLPTFNDNARFQGFRSHLIDQICEMSGGPCVYKGKTMVNAHQGMNVTEEEFNAMVADLVQAMNNVSIPQAGQDELLSRMAALKPDIVGH